MANKWCQKIWGRWKGVGAGDLAEKVEYKIVAEDMPNRCCIPATLYLRSHEKTRIEVTRFPWGGADVRLKTRNDLKSVKGSVFLYIIPGNLVTVLPQSLEKVKDNFVEKVNQIDSKRQGYLVVQKIGRGEMLPWKWGDRQHFFPAPLYCSAPRTLAPS